MSITNPTPDPAPTATQRAAEAAETAERQWLSDLIVRYYAEGYAAGRRDQQRAHALDERNPALPPFVNPIKFARTAQLAGVQEGDMCALYDDLLARLSASCTAHWGI